MTSGRRASAAPLTCRLRFNSFDLFARPDAYSYARPRTHFRCAAGPEAAPRFGPDLTDVPNRVSGAAGNHDRRLPRPELRAVQAQHLPPVEYAARMREGLVPSNG